VKRASLFNGFWLDAGGNRIRRIYREEYPELYRLHRLCLEVERANGHQARRWYRLDDGYALVTFPGTPRFFAFEEREAA
jgi:hypothetical protein